MVFDAHSSSRFVCVLLFEMGTQRRDVVILVAIRTGEIGTDILVHLEFVDGQTIYQNPILISQKGQKIDTYIKEEEPPSDKQFLPKSDEEK